MSALGQKQTLRLQFAMFALPPIADIRPRDQDVCFGPQADIYELRGAPAGQREHNKKSDNVGHYDIPTVAEPRADRFCLWMLVR